MKMIRFHSQESLYIAFVMIVLATVMIYWYTSPVYGLNGSAHLQ